MFIETSRPRELGDRARLVSPVYNASAKFYCVSFFYHMYGKHIGELETGRSGWGGQGATRRLRTPQGGLSFPSWLTWGLEVGNCAEDGKHNLAVLVVYRLLARSWGPYHSERLSLSPRPLSTANPRSGFSES